MTRKPRHISISIARPFGEVSQFTSNPLNMPKWAAGLSGSIKKVGDHWESVSPMGTVKVSFAPENDLGVIDHDVTLPNGQVFHNPLRVLKNDEGAEVVFTLYRYAEMSDADFEKDAGMVTRDLQTLKEILEE